MLSSMIDEHCFQKVPRNFSPIQSEPQTRSSFDGPNSDSRNSGTIDMTFNRRSLDWSRLQLYAPHSTCSNQQINNKAEAEEPRSNKDLHDLLQDWNFPSQPAVPPRLVVWGPYNRSDSTRPPLQPLSPSTLQASPSQSSFPQTPPPFNYKAPKRRREGHIPPSRPQVVTPTALTKRPRTAERGERGAPEFPSSPRYTNHDLRNYQMASTNGEGSAFFKKDYTMDPPTLRTPFSARYQNCHQESPVYPRNNNQQPRDPYNLQCLKSPLSCVSTPSPYHPSPKYLNQFYLPSPISPTSPFPPPFPSPTNSKFPHPQSPCANKHRHANLNNFQHSNIWSREWHQTFNQFRNEKGTY